MSYCSNCGTQNPPTAKFCTNCGAALPAVPGDTVSTPSNLPLQQAAIGTKVSFVAGDGKTYSGIIKEVNGDQYKIKYDAYNFEVWLARDQFTIISDTGNPVVYASTPAHKATYTSSTSSIRSTALLFFTHPGFWGCLLIIAGFFLDWMNYGYGIGITGINLLGGASKSLVNDHEQDIRTVLSVVCLGAIALSVIICLLYFFLPGMSRGSFVFFKILPLIAIASWLIVVVMNAGSDVVRASDYFRVFRVGLYLTAIGSLILAVSRSRK